jgi:hypothetical protein
MSDASPRVSIRHPRLQRGRTIRSRAAERALGQTSATREVVVVDDGSHDPRTVAALDEAAELTGVTLHRQANGGLRRRPQRPASRAPAPPTSCPLRRRLWLAPTFLERTVPVTGRRSRGRVVAHFGCARRPAITRLADGRVSLPALLARCTIHVSSLFRRALVESCGGYDPRFVHTDEELGPLGLRAARGWEGRLRSPRCCGTIIATAAVRPRRAAPASPTRSCDTARHEAPRPLTMRHVDVALGGMYST